MHKSFCARSSGLFQGSMPATATAEEGWDSLFDGSSLKGWMANELPENWKAIVTRGPRSHVFYVGADESKPAEFVNFDFKADVMTTPGRRRTSTTR